MIKCGRQVQVSVCSVCPLIFIVIAQVLTQPAVFRNREALTARWTACASCILWLPQASLLHLESG